MSNNLGHRSVTSSGYVNVTCSTRQLTRGLHYDQTIVQEARVNNTRTILSHCSLFWAISFLSVCSNYLLTIKVLSKLKDHFPIKIKLTTWSSKPLFICCGQFIHSGALLVIYTGSDFNQTEFFQGQLKGLHKLICPIKNSWNY